MSKSKIPLAGIALAGHRATVLVALASLTLAACAGSRPRGPAAPDAAPAHPAYETFDPASAEAPPVRPASAVDHDVPPRLMEGRVEVPAEPARPSAPRPRTVEGFRIQVFSGEDRASAERVRGEAEGWARRRGAEGYEATLAYIRPYYRVRVGAFATRGEAEAALAGVRTQFPEAFLVPDLVTVFE